MAHLPVVNGLILLIVLLALVSTAQSSESLSLVQPRAANNHTALPPVQNNQTLLKPLFTRPSNSTPRFLNLTGQSANPLVEAAPLLGTRAAAADGDGTCAPGSPCTNGACCSSSGFCGYSPDFCGADTCISNCDAKASCGQYAPAGEEKCPLNVCCVSEAHKHESLERCVLVADLVFCINIVYIW